MSTSFLHFALVINSVLFNSIWEGSLIVAAVWLVVRCLPWLSSASRYAIWLCTLVALVAVPMLSALKTVAAQAHTTQIVAADVASAGSASTSQSVAASRARPQAITVTKPQEIAPTVSNALSPRTVQRITLPETLVLGVALFWLLMTAARLFRLAMDFRELTVIRREGEAWRNAGEFPVCVSDRVAVPIAVGFWKPAVVLPRSILHKVDAGALQAILIHETAHLRRYDVWTNALAQILEALMVLNPVSWFVARQIVAQREIACDDWVVAQTDSSESFARALAAMAGGTRGRVPAAAPGAIGSRHALVERIAQLMDHQRPRQLRFSGAALASSLAFLTLIGFTLQTVSPALALPTPNEPAVQFVAVNAADCHEADVPPVLRRTSGPGSNGMDHLTASDRMLQKFSALHLPGTLTFQVNVDAAGHQQDFKILHSSNDPVLDASVERSVMAGNFIPARRACMNVASVYKSGLVRLRAPILRSTAYRYRILPEPGGAPKTCTTPRRDPYVVRKAEPQIPQWLTQLAAERSFASIVKVHVDASGHLMNAARYAVEAPADSAQKAFDNLTVSAAKRYVFAGGIRNCTPYKSAYLISTSFTKWLQPGDTPPWLGGGPGE